MWYCLFLTIVQHKIQDFVLSFEFIALLGVRYNYMVFADLLYKVCFNPRDQKSQMAGT